MAVRDLATIGLTADSKGMRTGMSQAGGAVKDFNKTVDRSNRNMTRSTDRLSRSFGQLNRLLLAVGASAAAIKGAQVADSFSRLRIELSNLLGSLSSANFKIKELRGLVQKLPVDLRILTTGFTKLTAAGVKDTNRVLVALTEGVLASGGSMLELEAAMLAVSQMSGKGVVAMEELRRQLGQAIPSALALMAKGLGLTRKELFKMVEQGALPAEEGIRALVEQLEKAFAGQAARFANTMSGQMTILSTKTQTVVDVLNTKLLLINMLVKAIESFGKVIGKVTEYVEDMTVDLSDAAKFMRDFVDNNTEIIKVALGFVAVNVALRVAIGSMKIFAVMMLGITRLFMGPIGLISLLVSLALVLKEDLPTAMEAGLKRIRAVVLDVVSFVLQKLGELYFKLFDILDAADMPVLEGMKKTFGDLALTLLRSSVATSELSEKWKVQSAAAMDSTERLRNLRDSLIAVKDLLFSFDVEAITDKLDLTDVASKFEASMKKVLGVLRNTLTDMDTAIRRADAATWISDPNAQSLSDIIQESEVVQKEDERFEKWRQSAWKANFARRMRAINKGYDDEKKRIMELYKLRSDLESKDLERRMNAVVDLIRRQEAYDASTYGEKAFTDRDTSEVDPTQKAVVDGISGLPGLFGELVDAILSSKNLQEALVKVIFTIIKKLDVFNSLLAVVNGQLDTFMSFLNGLLKPFTDMFDALLKPLASLSAALGVLGQFFTSFLQPFVDIILVNLVGIIREVTAAVSSIMRFFGVDISADPTFFEDLSEVAPDGIIQLKLDVSGAMAELHRAHDMMQEAVTAEEQQQARSLFIARRNAAILAEEQRQAAEDAEPADLYDQLDVPDFWQSLRDGLESFLVGLAQAFTDFWHDFLAIFNQDVIGGIETSLGDLVDGTAFRDIEEAFEGIASSLLGAVTPIENFFNNPPDFDTGPIEDLFNFNTWQNLWDDVWDGIRMHDFDLFRGGWGEKGAVENALNVDVPFAKFNQGGIVGGKWNGQLGAGGDTQLIAATPGEVVLPLSISRMLGANPVGAMERMLGGGRVQSGKSNYFSITPPDLSGINPGNAGDWDWNPADFIPGFNPWQAVSDMFFDSILGGGPRKTILGNLMGNMSTGTPYVPQDGAYFLHQGEQVSGQNSGSSETYVVAIVGEDGAIREFKNVNELNSFMDKRFLPAFNEAKRQRKIKSA